MKFKEKIYYKLQNFLGYAIIFIFLLLTQVYGIKNVKRLGNKILEKGDNWEKKQNARIYGKIRKSEGND